jgi:hypothetical protein
MTLSEFVIRLQDQFGVTAKEDLFIRLVNEAKDIYAKSTNWPHLEDKSDLQFQTNVREYVLASTALKVISIVDADGKEITQAHRKSYDNLFRPSSSMASTPSKYVIDGHESRTGIRAHIWPTPSAWSTGAVAAIRRIPDLATGASTAEYDYVPQEHGPAIERAAMALYHEQNDDPTLMAGAWQMFKDIVGSLAGIPASEVQIDR